MDQYDDLQDVQMIQISLDNLMTEGRRVNTGLLQKVNAYFYKLESWESRLRQRSLLGSDLAKGMKQRWVKKKLGYDEP